MLDEQGTPRTFQDMHTERVKRWIDQAIDLLGPPAQPPQVQTLMVMLALAISALIEEMTHHE